MKEQEEGAGPRPVVIVGGGLQGVHVAYYLRHRHGEPRVVVVERSAIAAAASSKGGGFLARGWGHGPTRPLHELGFDEHAALANLLHVRSYRRLPTAEVQHCSSVRAPSKPLPQGGPVPAPWLTGCARATLMDSDTAQVHPGELCARVFEASGADWVQATAVGVRLDPETGVVVAVRVRRSREDEQKEAEEEDIRCRAVVFAHGPWLPLVEDWLPGVSLPTEGIRSTSFVLELRGEARQQLESDPWACFCSEKDGTHLELYPRNDGTLYVCGCGGSDHVQGARLRENGDHGRPERVVADPERARIALALLARIAPDVVREADVLVRNACMRPCAPDAMPVMGRVHTDLYPNAFVTGNFNCWGILHAPAQGIAMAELVATGACRAFDIAPFSPSRFAPRAAARGRARRDDAVGEQW